VAKGAPGPVEFGAQEVRQALQAKGSAAELRVLIGVVGDAAIARVPGKRLPVPAAAESFAISAPERNTIVIEGRDAPGAVYGALEFAEQIAFAGGGDWSARIQPLAKSPYLAVRGVNAFLTAQGFDDPNSWYWSDAYWRSHLDQMARSRHNFIDFHGPWDLSVEWPNGFSYFVWLPDFPDVGVGRERAAKILARFRRILQMAADRGVRVGFMNYTASAPIGPWKAGSFSIDVLHIPKRDRPPHVAAYLPAEKLAQYTREAATVFLKALPELWMFGFRVGESGQPEEFYHKTYLEALKSASPSLNVYTRTWGADSTKLRKLAASMRNSFYVEPKYNGEHYGLPYQAVLGGRTYWTSGSYEDYTNYPRTCKIIWQIRAHGTHRMFHWGWPDYARRTVRSFRFGGGYGFSMEPLNAYFPETDYLHNNPQVDHRWSDWKHQQDWYWYLIWGRLSYDPETPDRVWLAEFNRRFGAGAGRLVMEALAESSRIVPFVYSYHNQGLDHIYFAPELETGDYPTPPAAWQGDRVLPYLGSLRNFLNVGTLDPTAMASPVAYVEERLAGKPSGRMTPFEAGAYLGDAADKSARLIAEAARRQAGATKEFACIRMDVEALAELARYYRDRILSATHLEFFNRTQHRPELSEAQRLLVSAVTHWDRLADVADTHFGPVLEPIRMRTYQFRWKDEGRKLGVILNELDRIDADFRKSTGSTADTIGHVPPLQAPPGKAIPIRVTAGRDRQVRLFYKKPGALGYTEARLQFGNRYFNTWEGEIPAADATPGALEYYFQSFARAGRSGYLSTLQNGPPYTIHITDDAARPTLAHRQPSGRSRGKSVWVEATVKDNAPLASVSVYYKRMPSYYEWIKVPMRSAGGGLYRAELPLTSEGVLYFFEALDENGNGAHHPNFLEDTPYYVIEGWNPRQP
jgi:hypothetical protein